MGDVNKQNLLTICSLGSRSSQADGILILVQLRSDFEAGLVLYMQMMILVTKVRKDRITLAMRTVYSLPKQLIEEEAFLLPDFPKIFFTYKIKD